GGSAHRCVRAANKSRGRGRDGSPHRAGQGRHTMTGIPAFVTETQKAALRARGLSDEDLLNITPEQAHKILNGAGTPPEPHRAEAERFLKALDPSPNARFTFQTFDDNKERRKKRAEANKLRKEQGQKELKDPFAAIKHGTLAEHWKYLVKLNTNGAGIYVTVNETDLKGRAEKNVTRVRAGFADLDGAPLEPMQEAKVLPHIVNET